jgi:hypothetical protein
MGESFPPEVVAKLNDKWLPDEAGTSCLLLLNCLTQINMYWVVLTYDEDERNKDDWRDKYDWEGTAARDDTGPCPEPKPDPIRDHQLAIGKLEWLRVRLPELLKQLDHSDKGSAFLKDVEALDSSLLSSIPEKIQKVLDGLSQELLRYGQENELPKRWETEGWCDFLLGVHPVRNIPELIIHLKQRAEYVGHDEKDSFDPRFGSLKMEILNSRCLEQTNPHHPNEWPSLEEEVLKRRFAVMKTAFRNARLAIRSLIHDPERWPNSEYDPVNFERSRLRMETLIDELSVIAAQDAKAEPPTTVNPLPGGDEVGKRRTSLRDCDLKAGSQFTHAIKLHPELETDRAAYDWYVDQFADQDELPKFETWAKYLRRFRAEFGSRKNQRGVGHETRSVVPGDKLEQQNRTEADF